MKKGHIFAISLALLFVAVPVFAQNIVPCDGVDCDTCDLFELANRILRFFITFAVLAAGFIFAWAGFKMVMSAGESHALSEAKGMMTNAVVGIVITLSAWLVMDTLMKLALNDQALGVWNNISCEGQPLPARGTQTQTGEQAGGVPTENDVTNASSGMRYVEFDDGGYTLRTTQTDDSLQENYINVSTKYRSQIATACQTSTVPNCTQVVTSLIANESRGDSMVTSDKGSLGIMQLTADNGGRTCTATNTSCIQEQINRGVEHLGTVYASSAVDRSLPNTFAAYNGGDATGEGQSVSGKRPPLAPSANCPGLLAYQCEIDPGGLAETQGYVANICRTLLLNGGTCQ